MPTNRLMDKDIVWAGMRVYKNQRKEDRIEDDLVGEGGSGTLWSSHSCGVTRYHSMMMSGGEGTRFINYRPALLPHQ